MMTRMMGRARDDDDADDDDDDEHVMCLPLG